MSSFSIFDELFESFDSVALESLLFSVILDYYEGNDAILINCLDHLRLCLFNHFKAQKGIFTKPPSDPFRMRLACTPSKASSIYKNDKLIKFYLILFDRIPEFFRICEQEQGVMFCMLSIHPYPFDTDGGYWSVACRESRLDARTSHLMAIPCQSTMLDPSGHHPGQTSFHPLPQSHPIHGEDRLGIGTGMNGNTLMHCPKSLKL